MGTSYIYKRDASRLFIALRDNGKRYKIYIPKESEPVIDGEEYDIDFVEQEDFHYAFDWKGKRFHCELVSRDQNKAVVKVNGVEYKFSLESLFSYIRHGMIGKDDKSIDENNITSPMPGKIVRIPVKVNEKVTAGQTVVVISAMKMESEYKVTRDAVIKKILVSLNDTVKSHQPLIIIE